MLKRNIVEIFTLFTEKIFMPSLGQRNPGHTNVIQDLTRGNPSFCQAIGNLMRGWNPIEFVNFAPIKQFTNDRRLYAQSFIKDLC